MDEQGSGLDVKIKILADGRITISLTGPTDQLDEALSAQFMEKLEAAVDTFVK